MIIVLAKCGNGYTGCDSEEVFFYEEGATEREIDADVYFWAQDNAESFFYAYFGCDEEYIEECDDYVENNMTYDWHIATYEEYLEYCKNWSIKPREF